VALVNRILRGGNPSIPDQINVLNSKMLINLEDKNSVINPSRGQK
jgi:hypothetical protein